MDKDALDTFIHDFPIHDVKIEYTMSELEDKDWNEQWEDNGFAPISIGNKILVYDSRHTDKAELSADDVQLKSELKPNKHLEQEHIKRHKWCFPHCWIFNLQENECLIAVAVQVFLA